MVLIEKESEKGHGHLSVGRTNSYDAVMVSSLGGFSVYTFVNRPPFHALLLCTMKMSYSVQCILLCYKKCPLKEATLYALHVTMDTMM